MISHPKAIALMVIVTLMWSIAGVVTRHLDAAHSFEVTFWRSLFNALALIIGLGLMRGAALWRGIVQARWPLWASGMCWAVMFTAFMVALTLTSVANVLMCSAVAPLITAVLSRLVLGNRLPWRTWLAAVAAGLGIAAMFAHAISADVSVLGTLVAMIVPLAAASNWSLLQHINHGTADPDATAPQDMLPAVLIGALISAAITLPLAWPLQASVHDLGLLGLLGVVQLAIPCLLVVYVSRALPAPEIALLGLLEVVFGVSWAWLGAGEQPAAGTLIGGALVLGALVINEALALRERGVDGYRLRSTPPTKPGAHL